MAGVGQALLQAQRTRRRRPALPPGPQRAGHGARGGRLRPDAQPAVHDGLHGLDRPGLDQHADRRGAGHRQPASRCCCCPVDVFATRVASPGAAGAGGPALLRRQSVNDAFRPLSRFFDRVWRPEQLPSALLGRDAGAHRPGGDRRGDHLPAAGRAGRGVRLARRAVRQAGLARGPPGARAGRRGAGRRGDPGRPPPADRRRRRGDLRRGVRRELDRVRPGDRHPGRRHPGRQGRAALGPPELGRRASARPAPRSPTRWPATPTWSSASAPGTATSPPRRAPRSQHPDVRFVNLNVAVVRRGEAVGAARWSRTPGPGWPRCRRPWTGTGSTGDFARRRGGAGRRRSTQAYHLGHGPLPAQSRGDRRGQRGVRRARRGGAGGRQHARRPAAAVAGPGPEAVPRRVRLLLHGLRDRRRARHQDGRPEPRGVRAGRRRLLPDDGAGDRHRGRPRASS